MVQEKSAVRTHGLGQSTLRELLSLFCLIIIATAPLLSLADTSLDPSFEPEENYCLPEDESWDGELSTILRIEPTCEAELMASDPQFARDYELYLSSLQNPDEKPVVTIYRTRCKETCVLGELWYKGERLCYTLEPPDKNNKRNISCIPYGSYGCKPYSSRRFPDVWKICDVPNRSYILIHAGNYVRNTKGCVLVGLTQGDNMVGQSRKALELLRKVLGRCDFTIEIKDEDPPEDSDSSPNVEDL